MICDRSNNKRNNVHQPILSNKIHWIRITPELVYTIPCILLKITYFYSFSIDPMPTLSRMKSKITKWKRNEKEKMKITQIKTVNFL